MRGVIFYETTRRLVVGESRKEDVPEYSITRKALVPWVQHRQ